MKTKPLKPPVPVREVMSLYERTSVEPLVRHLQASVDERPVDETVALDAVVCVEHGVPSRAQARREISKGRFAVDGSVVYDPDVRVAKMSRVTRLR